MTRIRNKWDLHKIKNLFNENGCELLSNDYTGANSKYIYKCNCGNVSEIKLSHFINGHRCSSCAIIKSKKTKENKYGDENYNNKIKHNKTCLYRYGDPNFKNHKKATETKIKIYGTGNPNILFNGSPFSRKEVRLKINETIRLKYGVDNVMKNPVIADKCKQNCFRSIKVKTPSGKTITLQGFEPQAYYDLLRKYKEDDILSSKKDMPIIKYFFKGKERLYYPDFYIPKHNLIIEVKSDYTKRLESGKILAKKQATINLGYKYLEILIDSKRRYEFVKRKY